VTPERFERLRSALARRQPDLAVFLENVHKPHNFAAVLRTADAVGCLEAHAVFAETDHRISLSSAAGVDRWVRVVTHATAEDALGALGARRLRLVAAHPSADAIDFRSVDFTRPTAIVLGQEKDGISEPTLAAVDELVRIPMAGMGASLNVSVAAALVLFEAQRQRAAAGFYDQPRLDPDELAATLFEWAYPRIATLCRRRGVDYPELSPDGELVGEHPR
jgi:tRNA (guanosine-2'-O-)-methyltransferase